MSKDYQAFFGLSDRAFSKDFPAEHVLRYPDLEELHYLLKSALDQGCVAALTGPVGAGKSTALRAFLTSLDPSRYEVLYVGHTASDRGLFRTLASRLGIMPAYLKGDLISQLHAAIDHAWKSKSRETILVVDDAHLLPDSLLVELRQFLNFEMDSATPLGLILAGQPQLRARLKEPVHEALDQRILAKCTLAGLSRQETDAYVEAHMKVVGGDPALFKPEAVDLAYHQAKGIPRALNNVLVFALIRAAWNETKVIDRKLVEEVIAAQTAG